MIKFSALYGMIDRPADVTSSLALTRLLLQGGVRVLQLRMKGAGAAAMLAVARALQPVCEAAGATLIVNDRLDVALAGGADGVHLGQDDLPLSAARKIAGGKIIIGISTHNEKQAIAAYQGGADYIGFGPCFSTVSKPNPDPQVTLEELSCVCRLGLPVVAIGGITLATVPLVARAGASAAAVISAINSSGDVAAAVREFISVFEKARSAV